MEHRHPDAVLGLEFGEDTTLQMIDAPPEESRWADGSVTVRKSFPDPDEDGRAVLETGYSSRDTAILHVGLAIICNEIPTQAETDMSRWIPIEVVNAGKPPIAGWLRTTGGSGREAPVSAVARRMDVTEQTAANYLTKFRTRVRDEVGLSC